MRFFEKCQKKSFNSLEIIVRRILSLTVSLEMRVINVAVGDVVLMVDNSVSCWNLVRLDCAKYSGDGLVSQG